MLFLIENLEKMMEFYIEILFIILLKIILSSFLRIFLYKEKLLIYINGTTS